MILLILTGCGQTNTEKNSNINKFTFTDKDSDTTITDNNEVVGGLTIYVLHRYFGTKPIAYIYDVGVSPEFQGQGLGKALIAEVCNFCKKNDFDDAHVEAESDDIDAVSFYRKTKFSSEMTAIHFTYNLS